MKANKKLKIKLPGHPQNPPPEISKKFRGLSPGNATHSTGNFCYEVILGPTNAKIKNRWIILN